MGNSHNGEDVITAADAAILHSALRGVVDWLSQPVQGTGYDAPASKDAQALAIIRGDCAAARSLAIRALLRVGIEGGK